MTLQMLQPEGAQYILRDTDDLLALPNISYHLLAGSFPPHKSEWLWNSGLSGALALPISPVTAAGPSVELPQHSQGREGSDPNLFGMGDLGLCCSVWEGRGGEEDVCSQHGPCFCTLELG